MRQAESRIYIQRVERKVKHENFIGITDDGGSHSGLNCFDDYRKELGPNLISLNIKRATKHEARTLS